MVMDHKNNGIAVFIMGVVIAFNVSLAVNFISASGLALAALFNDQNLFALAGAELFTVLLAYVICKHRSFSIPAHINSPIRHS